MTTTFEQQTGYVALDQEAEYAALTSYYGLSYGTTIPEDTPNIISGQDFNSPSFDSQYAQTFAGSHSKFDPPHGAAQDSPYISDGYSFDQQSGPVSTLSGPSLASAESSALGSPRSIPPLVQVSSSVWGELVDPSAAAGPDIVQGDGLLTDYRDSWTNLDPSFQQDIEFSDAKISDGFVGKLQHSSYHTLATQRSLSPCVSASPPSSLQSVHAFLVPPKLVLQTDALGNSAQYSADYLQTCSTGAGSSYWSDMSARSCLSTPRSNVSCPESFKTPCTPASAHPSSFMQKQNISSQNRSQNGVGPSRRKPSFAARLSPYASHSAGRLNALSRPALPKKIERSHSGAADTSSFSSPSSFPHRQFPISFLRQALEAQTLTISTF